MQIEVYDAYAHENVDLNVNVFLNDDFNALYEDERTSFNYFDIPWSISKGENGNFKYISISNSYFNVESMDDLNELLNYLGLTGECLSEEDSILDYIDPLLTRDVYFQKDQNTQYPNIRYYHRYSSYQDTNSRIDVAHDSSTAYGSPMGGGGGAFTYGKASAFYVDGDLFTFGYVAIECGGYDTGRTSITIGRVSNVATTNYVEVSESPGDEGFEPIHYKNNKNRGGGKKNGKTPTYQSNVLSNPDEPDETAASIVGSGYVNVYKIDKTNLANMGHCLFNDTLWTWFQGLTKGDPLDLIIALNVFPCSPDVGGAQSVRLGKFQCSTDSLGTQATGYPISKQFKKISFGSINVGEIFESFLDYEATSMSLYLPFIGEVDIPICEVMGGSISLDYIIDFVTGACTANVCCTKSYSIDGVSMGAQYSQHSYQGNCASQIPLTSASYGSMVGSIIGAAAQAAAGNVASASIGFLQDGATGQLAPTYRTKGNIQANSGFCAVLFPYITITRPITATPESFQEVMGYPSYMDKTLGSCQGLCICDNIDLHGVTGATESELNRIKQLCREGVYV